MTNETFIFSTSFNLNVFTMVKKSKKSQKEKQKRKRNPWKLAEEGEVIDTLARARIGEVNKSRWKTGEKPREHILETIKRARRRLGPGKLEEDAKKYFKLKSDVEALNEVKKEIIEKKDRRFTYKIEDEIQNKIDKNLEKIKELREKSEIGELTYPGSRYAPVTKEWEEAIQDLKERKEEKLKEKYKLEEIEGK